jgi:hypothetical protein
MRDQWRAHAAFIAEQLSDGRAFLQGAAPTIADVHCHMNFWFMKGAIAATTAALLREFPAIDAWYARVSAIGHGSATPMESGDALQVAKNAEPKARIAPDPFDPNGRKPGDTVKVSADDYGRDPVVGEIVFSNATEIAIRRSDPAVGNVVVHFPRAGFTVTPA